MLLLMRDICLLKLTMKKKGKFNIRIWLKNVLNFSAKMTQSEEKMTVAQPGKDYDWCDLIWCGMG